MQVEFSKYIINVVIVNKNNKNIYFRFKDDMKLYITASSLVPIKEIEKLIYKNEEAIIKMYERLLLQKEADSYFNYLGEKYTITIEEDSKIISFVDDVVYVPSYKELNKFYNEQCIKIFNSRIEKYLDVITDIPNFSLKIRKMKTRWGVCNRSNNTITLNSELLKKEVTLIDYVIIHEMCHFYHADHSKNFWNKVEKYYPYYKQARKMLKNV